MESTHIDIRFEGSKFSPKMMRKLTRLPIESLMEYGEIAKIGRYKDKPSPYGIGIIKIDKSISNEDLNKVLDDYIKRLYRKAEAIRKSGAQEIIFEIGSTIGTSSELSIDNNILKKLSKLRARINIYTVGDNSVNLKKSKTTKQIRNKKSAALDIYLKEVNQVEPIAPKDEMTLAKKIKSGDKDALEKLTKANLRYVVSVAKQYQNKGLSLPDLINEGNVGLIKAAQRFDPTKGFKFISYAVWWIRSSIIQALAEHSRIMSLPLGQIGTLSERYNAILQREKMDAKEPNQNELFEIVTSLSDLKV
jgi:RNA polymerase sigma factor (sigma-70 family)